MGRLVSKQEKADLCWWVIASLGHPIKHLSSAVHYKHFIIFENWLPPTAKASLITFEAFTRV